MAYGGSPDGTTPTTQKLAPLTWREETINAECCGRSFWQILQLTRAIDNKHIGSVSAFRPDAGPAEEVSMDITSWVGQSSQCSTNVRSPDELLSTEKMVQG